MSHNSSLDEHILSIVQLQKITEQIDLQNNLKEKGYEVPQATLSRRLKKLKIAKVSGIYQVIDFKTAALPLILDIRVSEYGLIVLHTLPGSANSLAFYMDRKYVSSSAETPGDSGILGTIAGDDTILLIIKSKAALQGVLKLLAREFPYLDIPD